MISGAIIINKSKGCTSHDVVAKLRRILGQKKIGHTGTLDPLATGVLPICLGRGTKLSDRLTASKKTYKVGFRLGISTDTEDITGNIIRESNADLTYKHIISTILSFVGDIDQVPPMYSAIKINGKKLYELARQGKTVDRAARRITIYSINDIVVDGSYIEMIVECSKGTYIRSLCRDIGEALEVGATMTSLIRLKTGIFDINNSYTIEEIEELVENNKLPLIGLEELLKELPKIYCSEVATKLLLNGNQFDKKLIKSIDTKSLEEIILQKTEVLVYTTENILVGIYKYKIDKFYPECILLT